jgi:predicted MFS family arabinose efflux permease
VTLGARADRRRDYGLAVVIVLLVLGSVGFLLMTSEAIPVFVVGALVAFTLGWGWPGLFNLAVVDSHRDTPGSASGVSQTGIYVGAAAGPLGYGLLAAGAGYGAAAAAAAVAMLIAAGVLWLARRETMTRALPGVDEVREPSSV